MRVATRATEELGEFLAQRDQVVDELVGLDLWIQAAHQPPIVARNTGRTVSGVTLLRLNATNRHHRLTTDVDCQQRRMWKTQVPGSDEQNVVGNVAGLEDLDDSRDRDPKRQRDVIGETEWPGSGTALPTVDRNEVDAALPELIESARFPRTTTGRLE